MRKQPAYQHECDQCAARGYDDSSPILPAYLAGKHQLQVWCRYCSDFHLHGLGDGHRVAHCLEIYGRTPYHSTGYVLVTKGEMPKGMRTIHSRLPTGREHRGARGYNTMHRHAWCHDDGSIKVDFCW